MKLYQVTVTLTGEHGPVMTMQRNLSLQSLNGIRAAMDRLKIDDTIISELMHKPRTVASMAKLTKRSQVFVTERMKALGAKPVANVPGTKQKLWSFTK